MEDGLLYLNILDSWYWIGNDISENTISGTWGDSFDPAYQYRCFSMERMDGLTSSIDDTDNIGFGRYVSNITAMEIGA